MPHVEAGIRFFSIKAFQTFQTFTVNSHTPGRSRFYDAHTVHKWRWFIFAESVILFLTYFSTSCLIALLNLGDIYRLKGRDVLPAVLLLCCLYDFTRFEYAL